MITFAQAFTAFFAALVVTKSYADLKRGRENIVMFLFWVCSWAVIIFVAMYPAVVDLIFIKLSGGTNNNIATALAMGLTFVFFIIYRLYIKADRVEKTLHKLVSELAIKEQEEE